MTFSPERLRRIAARMAAALAVAFSASAAHAIAPEVVRNLALGESDAKITAIAAVVASGEGGALALLQALLDGEAQTAGERVLRVKDNGAIDLATGETVSPLPEPREDVVLNNRVRRELATAIAALKLTSDDAPTRLAAAKELQRGADEEMLPAIRRAADREQDPEIRNLLTLSRATIELSSTDKTTRIGAIRALAGSRDANTKMLLLPLLERKGGEFVEPDSDVRAEAELSLRTIEGRLATGEMITRVFSGVSLGSILLLAALGLAITYGLMGVINMAHGELIMVGAYATYVVQNLFRTYAPGAFDAYLIAAVPVAFVGVGGHRHRARAQRDPLSLRPPAGNAARDLGHQPHPDPGDAHAVRRAERRRSRIRPGCRVAFICCRTSCCPTTASRSSDSPQRSCAADLAAADPHAAGTVRPRRDAEPGDGRLRWAFRPAVSTRTRSASVRASRG